MVYQTRSQLQSYHHKPEPFLTTSQHFFDSTRQECPNPESPNRSGPHKKSTFGKCYSGSTLNHQLYNSGKIESQAKTCTLGDKKTGLFPDTKPMTAPSSTYRGNGTFTVEYPHSTLTYKSLKLVPYAKLGWKSEYGDKFTNKKLFPGYSVLSSRR